MKLLAVLSFLLAIVYYACALAIFAVGGLLLFLYCLFTKPSAEERKHWIAGYAPSDDESRNL